MNVPASSTFGKALSCGLLALSCVSLARAFGAKTINSTPGTSAACLDEHDATLLLRREGLTNCLIDEIERNSSGTAILITFQNLDLSNHWGTLVLTSAGTKLIQLPVGVHSPVFSDDLQLVVSFKGDEYVFASGDRLAWKCGPGYVRLRLYASPGGQAFSLRCSDKPEQAIVFAKNPRQPVLTVSSNDLSIWKVFHCSGKVCLAGPTAGGDAWDCLVFSETAGAWRLSAKVSLPPQWTLLDVDSDFSHALCCRVDALGRSRGGLLNLKNGHKTNLGMPIWRRHGLLLDESLVRHIENLIRTTPGKTQ